MITILHYTALMASKSAVDSPSPLPPLKFPVRIPRCATAGRFLRAANLSPRCSFSASPRSLLVVMHIIARGDATRVSANTQAVVLFVLGGNCHRLRLIMRRVINLCVPRIDYAALNKGFCSEQSQ